MNKSRSITETFEEYLYTSNVKGSGKAASYLRALDLLGPILTAKGGHLKNCAEVRKIFDSNKIRELYHFIKEQQRLKEHGIFGDEKPESYWRDGYFSAALKSYLNFLLVPEQMIRNHFLNLFQKLPRNDLLERITLLNDDHNFERFLDTQDFMKLSQEGRESLSMQKKRLNQSVFRALTLKNYNGHCCITSLDVPEVLRASHILPWAEYKEHRMNPENGLCLSATYDSAFDRNLISLDDRFQIVLSSALRDHYSSSAVDRYFRKLEGKKINLPSKFLPGIDFIREHRAKLRN